MPLFPAVCDPVMPRLLLLSCLAALALAGPTQAAPHHVGRDTPAPACPGQDVMPTAATLTAAREATLCLVNRERTTRGLGALRPVGSLTALAAAYARRMAREDFFDHTAPNGATFLTRIQATSYLSGPTRSWSVGENLAWGTGRLATPESIVAAWMKSPGHRHNILTPGFDELGLGVAAGAPQSGVSDGHAATYVNEFGSRHR